MEKIECKQYLDKIKENAKEIVTLFKGEYNVTPTVKVIQIGDSEDSNRYVRNKCKHIKEIGANAIVEKISKHITTKQLIEIIKNDNQNDEITAIIVQKPLPNHIDEYKINDAIDPIKDLDCSNSINMGKLLTNSPDKYIEPCTPKGIIYLLKSIYGSLSGKNILVLGRSIIVGKPLAAMLTNEDATVTLAHSKTNNPSIDIKEGYIQLGDFDIVVSAIGKGHFIKIASNADDSSKKVFVDVGINFDDNGKMIGDIDIENSTLNNNSYYTPVPGGVGLLTCGMVIANLLNLTQIQLIKKIYKYLPIPLESKNKCEESDNRTINFYLTTEEWLKAHNYI